MAASRLMLLLKGAAFARRLGLGPVIDRVRPAVLRRVGRGKAQVRGIVLEAETVEDRMYYGQLQGGREGFMADLFERSVEPGSVVADVGANVGFFTLLAARRVGAEGAVYAFEPDARNVRRLRANLARNGVEGVVTVVPKALSAADGVERFYVREPGDVSSLYADEPYDRVEEVETRRRRSLLCGGAGVRRGQDRRRGPRAGRPRRARAVAPAAGDPAVRRVQPGRAGGGRDAA